jgi:PPE-repeat protein
VLEFALLPPEVISGQLYSGPGASSMLAAAEAWQQIAAEIEIVAGQYDAILVALSDAWQGPSAAAMLNAAVPYARWLHATATLASDTSFQARAAAAAFQSALDTVVAPEVVAANRAELASLVATNIAGQNSPAIAANEALYAQMWASDTTGMQQYWLSSRAVTTAIVPFHDPGSTTKTPTGSRAPNAATTPSVHTSPSAMVHRSAGGMPAAASDPTGDDSSMIFGMDPTTALSVLVSAAGFGAMAATNAANRPIPMALGALGGALAGPASVTSPVSAGADIVRGAAVVPPNPLVLASTASAHTIGALSTPPTWDTRVANLSSARPLASVLGAADNTPPLALPVGVATPPGGGRQRRRKPYSQPEDFEYGRPTPKILGHNPPGG